MALTLANVRTNVRDHIDEPSANYWSDAELNRLIQTRERNLWRKIMALRKDYWLASQTLTLVVGQATYTLNADTWRIRSIRTITSGYQDLLWLPGDPTSPEFIAGLRSDVPVSNPFRMFYALENLNTLLLSPLPQTALAANIDYIQKPTVQAADTDTFLIPDEFLDWVEFMASADALAKGPVGDPATWMQKAKDAWAEIADGLDTPRSDQGPDVVQGFFQDAGF